jgi:hypothetical protein
MRKKVSRSVEHDVLVRSRRRCCLCFALDGDAREKRGQIAHIDRDPGNDSEANLAFLCFAHHDQYDSITSQSKGLTKWELIAYRDQLYKTLDMLSREPLLGAFAAGEGLADRIGAMIPIATAYARSPNPQLEQRNDKTLLQNLLGSIQGWYEEIVEGIRSLRDQQGRQPPVERIMKLGFAYVWRRRYLPNVVGLVEILSARDGMLEITNEVDGFLELLTAKDWKDPDKTNPLSPIERRYHALGT